MMFFILKPPLEHIALVKIATTFWHQSDIKDLLKLFTGSLHRSNKTAEGSKRKWKFITNTVAEKVSDISLPILLKWKLLHLIKQIGLQIFNWIKYHNENFDDTIHLPKEFYWTSTGTINLKKTAEEFVKDEGISAPTRYKLACIYCLEEYIPELWSKVPEYCRRLLYERDPVYVEQHILWTYDLKQDLPIMYRTCQRKDENLPFHYMRSFLFAAEHGNKAAVEYFFQKITPEEREDSSIYVLQNREIFSRSLSDTPKEYLTDVLCFFLSQINQEQQIKLFTECHYKLDCFLIWPWHNFLLETACLISGLISGMKYYLLMKGIIHYMSENKDCKYYQKFVCPDIVGKIWQKSSDSNKIHMFNCYIESFLVELFEIKELKSIELILTDAALFESQKMLSSDWRQCFYRSFMLHDRWDFLKFIIEKSTPSKDSALETKKKIYESIKQSTDDEETKNRYKRKCDKLFSQLENSILGHNKRKSEEEGDGALKKLCCAEFMGGNTQCERVCEITKTKCSEIFKF